MSTENKQNGLQIPWVKCITNDGKTYYKNGILNKTRWEEPIQHIYFGKVNESYSNKGSYTWNINGDQYVKMIQSKVGECHESQVFQIANLKWRILCYPNGRKEKQKDSFKIFIRLLNIPNGWQNILVQRRIQCIETGVSGTIIGTYDHDDNSFGWVDGNLLLSELKQLGLNQINIKISLKIIQIISKNNEEIIYYNILPIKTQQTIKWDINHNLLKQFDNAYWGKPFESPLNDNSLFIIRCYPKGRTKDYEGYVSLYLKWIHLPFPNISKIKLKFTLECIENGIKKTGTGTLNAGNRIGFSKFCECNKLKPNWFSSLLSKNKLTLTVNYKTLAIYDKNGEEFETNQWNIYDNKYNYKNCFLQSLSWICIKCNKINKQNHIICIKCQLERQYNRTKYLEKRTFKEIEEQLAIYSDIPNYNTILMEAAVKEEKDGIVFHKRHPSYQNIRKLQKKNKTKLEMAGASKMDNKHPKTESKSLTQQLNDQKNDEKFDNNFNVESNIKYDDNDKEEQKQTNEWNCSICTFLNVYENKQCVMCDLGKRPIEKPLIINNNKNESKLESKQQQNNSNSNEIKENEKVSEYVVKMWLQNEVKLPQYISMFIEEGYDDMITIIESINENDLLEMGINKKGHRKKIMIFINKYKQQQQNNNNEVNMYYNNDGVEGVNIDDTAQHNNPPIAGVNIEDTAK